MQQKKYCRDYTKRIKQELMRQDPIQYSALTHASIQATVLFAMKCITLLIIIRKCIYINNFMFIYPYQSKLNATKYKNKPSSSASDKKPNTTSSL